MQMHLLEKGPINQLTKQTHTSMRCQLRHTGGFLQIREEFSYLKIECLLQATFTLWHTECTQLCKSHLRGKKPWRWAVLQVSHGSWVPSRINEQLLRRFGTSPEPSQQAGRVTRCHTQSHTILLAHQYFGAWFLVKAVFFQINTPEKCWVASTSSLSSF